MQRTLLDAQGSTETRQAALRICGSALAWRFACTHLRRSALPRQEVAQYGESHVDFDKKPLDVVKTVWQSKTLSKTHPNTPKHTYEDTTCRKFLYM